MTTPTNGKLPLGPHATKREFMAGVTARVRAEGDEPAVLLYEEPQSLRSGLVVAQWDDRGGKRVAVTLLREDENGDRAVLAIDTIDPESANQRTKLIAQVADGAQELRDDAHHVLLALAREVNAARAFREQGGGERADDEQADETPWAERVDGAALADELVDFIARYIVLPEASRVAIALWVMHTYLLEVADHTPYIWLNSPTKECGKSSLLRVLAVLVHRPWHVMGASPAALFRKIHADRNTLLLDEIDSQQGHDETAEAMRNILNTGFQADGQVARCEGDDFKVVNFSTYCPKVIAGIRGLPSTVVSRAIPIPMERARGATIEKARTRRLRPAAAPLRQKLARFAADGIDALRGAEPEMPNDLGDRQKDIWEPLAAIADLAGGEWPWRARAAAVMLHAAEQTEDDRGLLLLADLRDVFEAASGVAHLASASIIDDLIKREDRPWAEASRGGQPLTKNGLARLLARFQVKPELVRIGTAVARGYKREKLQPLWEKYLRNGPASAANSTCNGPPATPQADIPPSFDFDCNGVTVETGGEGEEIVKSGGPGA